MPELRMPSLGADMDAGTVVEWRIAPGDTVARGDVVAVVETDKADLDIEAYEEGVVDEIVVPVGRKVAVGTVLATLAGAGAGADADARGADARRRASPRARRLAARARVDLEAVAGTGERGAVTGADVDRATALPAAPGRAATMRGAIGSLMARSKREIPHYYLGTHVDVSRALGWLAERNAGRPVTERLIPAALLLRAVALAAREVPEMNGWWVERAFRPAESVDLGVAVSLRGGGLVAPAIRGADRLGPEELMGALADLVRRARSGGLRSGEADPTITVTSLGDEGVETVFGVISPPQVAMVGFGTIAERPWAAEGTVDARPVLHATLSADHRVSDGLRGARFLAAIDHLLQAPEGL